MNSEKDNQKGHTENDVDVTLERTLDNGNIHPVEIALRARFLRPIKGVMEFLHGQANPVCEQLAQFLDPQYEGYKEWFNEHQDDNGGVAPSDHQRLNYFIGLADSVWKEFRNEVRVGITDVKEEMLFVLQHPEDLGFKHYGHEDNFHATKNLDCKDWTFDIDFVKQSVLDSTDVAFGYIFNVLHDTTQCCHCLWAEGHSYCTRRYPTGSPDGVVKKQIEALREFQSKTNAGAKKKDTSESKDWILPSSGFGEFQDKFDQYYDKAKGIVMIPNNWRERIVRIFRPISNEEHNARSCEMAGKWILEYIRVLGYNIIDNDNPSLEGI